MLTLIRSKTRKVASYGIILMLIAFLPVHITMLIDAPITLDGLTVTPIIVVKAAFVAGADVVGLVA